MRTRFSTAILGSVLVLFLSPLARAGDPPAEDPASMLRRARVAETVDHDLPKAMDLYRKVFAAAGDSDTSRDAALHLMDLLEARGDRPGTLEFAKALTDRFGARLDDAMKRQVHETMARTLPAGSHAKSPLGDVYVLPAPGSASNPSPSPLETKILAILSRLDGVEENGRGPVEADVLSALRPVGRDALPALERAMNDARPERARFAAQAIAKIAPDVALPILLRAIKDGDGFARAAASGGLEAIQPSTEVSADFVAAVEPLLDLPELAPRATALLEALVKHMDAPACLSRFDRGGPRAARWLAAAAEKSPADTAERIVALGTPTASTSDSVAAVAGYIAGVSQQLVSGSFKWVPGMPGLTSTKRIELLQVVVRTKATAASATAATLIAHAVLLTGDASEQSAAASLAWGFALDAAEPAVRFHATESLVIHEVSPTVAVFDSPSRSTSFEEAVAAILARPAFQQQGWQSGGADMAKTLFPTELFGVPALWAAVERLTASAATSGVSLTALARLEQRLGDSLPPPSEDARWLRVLARSPGLAVRWMRRAAGRIGDPAVLEVARADLARTKPDSGDAWPLDLVATYRGPGRGAFALDVLETRRVEGWGVLAWGRDDPEFWPLLAKRLDTYSPERRKYMLSILANTPSDQILLPPSLDTVWLAEFRRPAPRDLQIVYPFVWAAARSGSPEYVTILRAMLAEPRDRRSAYFQPMAEQLKNYTGTDRRAFLVELLSETKYEEEFTPPILHAIWAAVDADLDQDAMGRALDGIARSPMAPGNDRALRRFYRADRRTDVIAVLQALEKPGIEMRTPYRLALVQLAKVLHLVEAIPFLLKEYREGTPYAAAALDEIRAYNERIRTFSSFADGKDPLSAEIDAAKTGPSVELRRAAVFALAATHGAKAVPALLDIARTTADEPVRKAAIEMIEQIARGTAAGGPAGTAKPPAPAAPPVPAPSPTPGVDEPPTEK